MKKQIPVRNKVVLCFSAIIVIILFTQLLFNMFFLKPFVSAVKIGTIEYSFNELKDVYSNDIDDVDSFAQSILEYRGIRLAISKNDEILRLPSVSPPPRHNGKDKNESVKHKGPDPLNDGIFDKSMFSKTPKAVIEKKGDDQWIVLRGCFDYEGDTIYATMTFYMPTIDNRVDFYEYLNIGIMIVALFVAIIPAFIFSRSLTKPITEIEQVAQSVSELDFTHSARENISSKELASLAKSINTMSDNLQSSIEELQKANEKLQGDIDYKNKVEEMQRLFIANVSHEMKTPLGVLQLYCENLKSNIEGIDKEYYYDIIVSETQKLNEMVVRMLDISSIESGVINMQFHNFCLSDLCSLYANKITNAYTDRKIEVDIEQGIFVNGDASYIEKALSNYVANALNYAKADGLIKIELKKNGDKAIFSVYNDGESINKENFELIWEPFYRSERARTRTENNNVGLGLSIVKSVIEKHNGTVNLENKDNGVEFSFTLPVTEN